jgi:hypothetical protein
MPSREEEGGRLCARQKQANAWYNESGAKMTIFAG